MAKYCKPMGLFVTYLDCMDCEDKECRQPQERKENKMIKRYLHANINDIVYLVFKSKREGHESNVVLKCKVDTITINNKEQTLYMCQPICNVADKTDDMSKYKKFFMACNSSIDTGLRIAHEGVYPIFTTKERCVEWLKK